jgi:hypothetical protein
MSDQMVTRGGSRERGTNIRQSGVREVSETSLPPQMPGVGLLRDVAGENPESAGQSEPLQWLSKMAGELLQGSGIPEEGTTKPSSALGLEFPKSDTPEPSKAPYERPRTEGFSLHGREAQEARDIITIRAEAVEVQKEVEQGWSGLAKILSDYEKENEELKREMDILYEKIVKVKYRILLNDFMQEYSIAMKDLGAKNAKYIKEFEDASTKIDGTVKCNIPYEEKIR